MTLTAGKNYELVNQFGIHYDLYNPSLGKEHLFRIYGKFDLLVDGTITESPSDFWIVMHDLDGTTFAQPIDGNMLATKLMSLAFVPLDK